MNVKGSIHKKLFLSHFFAVILVSGSIGTYFFHSAYDSLKQNLQSRLKNSAALVSRTIDADELEAIRVAEDVRLPVYSRYLANLRDLRRTNPDIDYLYIMRRQADHVFFVIDTDSTDQQALPGQPYEETMPSLFRGFDQPSVDDQIFVDQWGAFMSGYAPIVNGAGRYLVGIDMRANEVNKKFLGLKIAGGISLLCSLLLAVFFSRVLSRRFILGIRLLVERCEGIADGRLEDQLTFRSNDEFGQLINAFNRMSSKLAISHEKTLRAENALTEANEALEFRVNQRTEELEAVNQKLKAEIAEKQRIQQALIEAARTDPLTGLLNRRAIHEHLDHQVSVHQRTRQPFTILLADVDRFKEINDRYGHAIGDQVLCEITHLIQEHIRPQDEIARWGGEEFLILLPDTDLDGGVALADRIRQQLAQAPILPQHDPNYRFTISIGVAQFQENLTVNCCIQAADSALYQAKDMGRNLVVPVSP